MARRYQARKYQDSMIASPRVLPDQGLQPHPQQET